MNKFVKTMDEELPRLRVAGNFIDGSGLPHIVNYSKREVRSLKQYGIK